MGNARTNKTHKKYMKVLAERCTEDGCGLCEKNKYKLIKKFKYWKIINNLFPYDRIARTHHMVLPKKHTSYKNLTKAEREELELIKVRYINKKYEFIMETTDRKKSIPEHFHLHLIILKD